MFCQYFDLDIIVSIVINSNTIRNLMLFYYYLGAAINCLLVFLDLVFEVNLKGF